MSPTKRATSSDVVSKWNAPSQSPPTLSLRRHADVEASAPGSMAKPTPLRRRKLGNSQRTAEPLLQKWGEIEPLRKEKKERLASNPRGLRLKASNLTLSSQHHEVSGSSLEQTTNLDIALSDSDETIVRRKRSPRKAINNNKSPERKRPVTVFDESSEEDSVDSAARHRRLRKRKVLPVDDEESELTKNGGEVNTKAALKLKYGTL
ncbi:hypothetical protein PG989_000159 [Apiospora arundinis]